MGDPTARRQARHQPARSRREPALAPQRTPPPVLQRLQATVGNRGMQQLLGGVRGLIGEGAPLPAALRAEHEQRFGADFGDVRLHDHAGAHQLAQGQLARAFTLGRDIVFNQGFYRPATLDGRRLIAHELAHVVQQGAGGARGSTSGPAHEAAADAAAQAVLSGAPGRVHAGPAAAHGIQREPLSAQEIAKLSQDQLRARLLANEKESGFMMNSNEYDQRLYRENLELKRRIQADAKLLGVATPVAAAAAAEPDPAFAKTMESINAELADVEPLVNRIAMDVLVHPADHALNAVRNLDARVRADEKAVREFEAVAGSLASQVHGALVRFQVMQKMLATAVTAATAWHEANPAGESLGMMHERHGTWLAGAGSEQWDKGGLHYVPGALAYAGAFGVAALDAVEKLASMGYHDAATAVSQAYTRGDISWNEGESILWSAAWRALLIAAVSRGAGMATSRLGVTAAKATGLASTTLRYGAVAGAVPGGLSAAASLGTQALMTKLLEDQLWSPAAKAIWNQDMPKGKDWAIAIPMGILMGGIGGMRGVELANDKLVGSIIQTPDGPMKIVTITKLKVGVSNGKPTVTDPGVMVLQPVGAKPVALPPPALSELAMVFDPLTNSWVYPKAPPTGLATLPSAKPAAPAAGGGVLAKPALAAPAQPQPLLLPPGPKPAPMLPPGPVPPLQLQPGVYEDFGDLGHELAKTPGSGFGTPTVWSVTPGGVAFATPPVPGVPLYAPNGVLPPSSYFAGKPPTWTLSGPLRPNFTPFEVLPGHSATSRTLARVRSARGPNARGAAGGGHVAESSAGSSREVTLELPGGLTRRSDVLSPTVAGTVNQEVKNYLRFRGSAGGAREVGLTPFMQTEITRDAMLPYYHGQQPVWVFTDAPPSLALRAALARAGIPWIVATDRLPVP